MTLLPILQPQQEERCHGKLFAHGYKQINCICKTCDFRSDDGLAQMKLFKLDIRSTEMKA